MKLDELISKLQKLRRAIGGDADVRITVNNQTWGIEAVKTLQVPESTQLTADVFICNK